MWRRWQSEEAVSGEQGSVVSAPSAFITDLVSAFVPLAPGGGIVGQALVSDLA